MGCGAGQKGVCSGCRTLFFRTRRKGSALWRRKSFRQLPPGEQELWEEYRRRYLELVQPRCTPGLLKHGAVDSCARPGKYSLFAAGCQVSFAMKTAQKAVVELSCPRGSLRFIYRFTLQPGPAGWLVARIQYHHSNETTWHIDHYL